LTSERLGDLDGRPIMLSDRLPPLQCVVRLAIRGQIAGA
jgi:hypothetical protein